MYDYITNSEKFRRLSDEELARHEIYIKHETDYDEDIDGEWVECGSDAVYVSMLDGYESEDVQSVESHNLWWLRQKYKE